MLVILIWTAVSAFAIAEEKKTVKNVVGLRDVQSDINVQPGVTRDSAGDLTLNGHGLDSDYRGSHNAIDNHLDISKAVRDNCVTGQITNHNSDGTTVVRTALIAGASCSGSASAESSCVTKYEAKYRGDHRAGQGEPGVNGATGTGGTYDNSYTMYGEVHLCEWLPLQSRCEAGSVLTVCPEASEATPYVVEVYVANGGGGLGGPPNNDLTPSPTPGGHGVNFQVNFPCTLTVAEVEARVTELQTQIAAIAGVDPSQVTIMYTHSTCAASFVQGGASSGHITEDVHIACASAGESTRVAAALEADGGTGITDAESIVTPVVAT